MVRARALRVVLSLALCALSTACALVMSFGDYDTSAPGERAPTSVRGRVEGLEGEGTLVHIRVNGTHEIASGNGTFTVEGALTPGRSYRIEATSEGYACAAQPSEGDAAPDGDLEANIHCDSQNARLASLRFVDGEFAPPFDAGTTRYALRAPLFRFFLGIEGTATPESASAAIALGPDFVPGARGAAALLPARVTCSAARQASGVKRSFSSRRWQAARRRSEPRSRSAATCSQSAPHTPPSAAPKARCSSTAMGRVGRRRSRSPDKT